MKKKAVISVISSAMLITSAAASVYASAASIAPAPSLVSNVQITFEATYPPTYPADDYEDYTVPTDTAIVQPTTGGEQPDMTYKEFFMDMNSSWINQNPEEVKDLCFVFKPANLDNIIEEAEAAGEEYKNTKDFEGLEYNSVFYNPFYDYRYDSDDMYAARRASYLRSLGFGEKFYELMMKEVESFCSENGITPIDVFPGYSDACDTYIRFYGNAEKACALLDMPEVRELTADYYEVVGEPTEPPTEGPLTKEVDQSIYDELDKDPTSCHIAFYLDDRKDQTEHPEFADIASVAAENYGGNYYREDMYRLLLNREYGHTLDNVLKRCGITEDEIEYRELYHAEVVIDREKAEALIASPEISSIYFVPEPDPNAPEPTICAAGTVPLTDNEIRNVKGDANCDGKLTVADCVAVLQYIANQEKYPLSADGIANADVDGLNGISGGDAKAIQKLDAGIADCNYSTKEEFIDLLVSDDPAFSDHGFIYAPDLKYDALMNVGSENRQDVLIIYGPKSPDDVKEIYVAPENTIYDYSFITWDTFFRMDQLNGKDYSIDKTYNCFSGNVIDIYPKNGAAIRDGEWYADPGKWRSIKAAVFIEGMIIDDINGSDKWTVEDFMDYLSQQTYIAKPTSAC